MSDEQNADPGSAQIPTDLPDIVPREVWRKARIELLEKEKALTRQRRAPGGDLNG